MQSFDPENLDEKALENSDWLEALEDVRRTQGDARCLEILRELQNRLLKHGVSVGQATLNTPYRNTISAAQQPAYPGNMEVEQRLENMIRWNAMAMVLRAYDSGSGVGGHIATYQSAATLFEVALNHHIRGENDLVMFQAHASPGLYARAFLEGRLSEQNLDNFRRELADGGGLPSYPHPRRMPDFWQLPSASMGLATPSAIYQARFMRYLENRGLKAQDNAKVWCFIGDGESDEPEVLGTVSVAAREKLDNLVMVINCNLQRLDGPVRGNGKIIQELEQNYRGAGWNVIKVIWGSEWDTLFAQDHEGVLQARMDRAVDGDYQFYSTADGKTVRDHWVEGDPRLAALMAQLNDDEIRLIKRGGEDRKKLHAAFERARQASGRPTVILVKTVKGQGMGASGQGQNTAHQKKQISPAERIEIGRRLQIPLSDAQLAEAAFYRPESSAPEIQYLLRQREALGGAMPRREVTAPPLNPPELSLFRHAVNGSERAQSTTMAFVKVLSSLLKDTELGRYVVPIVPDEARTFGMESLFKTFGIYSSDGQRYKPVDASSLLPYTESKNGQLLQEGICETGAIASFMAAGTAYANAGLPMIPFYIFYSIFGFQRVGDMIWACGDALTRGFLLGGTAGRTTLNGEGLQHQDGHSPLLASTVPSVKTFDPAFAYEVAILIRHGIERMYRDGHDEIFYLMLYNENYPMPAMPEGCEPGVIRGLYCLEEAPEAEIHLIGSGSVMQEVLKARQWLSERGYASSLWSATSYVELHREALTVEGQNRRDGGARSAYVSQCFESLSGRLIAASDYMKALPQSIAPYVNLPLTVLGTDGYGLSEDRGVLREHFEVSWQHIAWAALPSQDREQFRAALGVAGEG